MTFRHMHTDVQSERLLLVALEEYSFGSSHRHIRASVIRRAVPHSLPIGNNSFQIYADDHPDRCKGYRVASYVFSKNRGTYVDDMQLRGQIDIGNNPLHDGKPYGNSISFKPYEVCQNSARAISDFYTKMDKFLDKYSLKRQPDSFYVALNHLAQFLKITKVAFFKPPYTTGCLNEADRFMEIDIAFAEERINEMLAPFLQIAKSE